MNYKQLTQERYQIYALLKSGQKKSEIAKVLGVHKSTIGRKLKHNQGKRRCRPKGKQHDFPFWFLAKDVPGATRITTDTS